MSSDSLHPVARRRYYGTEGRVAHYAASRLGMTPGSVGQLVRSQGIHLKTAALIDAALAVGCDRTFALLYMPIEAAVLRRPRQAWSLDLMTAAQEADLKEDEAENAYRGEPSAENLRAWLSAMRTQHVAYLDLYRAGMAR